VTAGETLPDPAPFCAARLEGVFADCFFGSEHTLLIGGATEPLYLPAGDDDQRGVSLVHRLYYREDYFASALHEVAHWCIAGKERRRQRDFGYWYAPDGRNLELQAAFQAVEVKPQALEWYFSQACGYAFRASLDNIEGGEQARRDEQRFIRDVVLRTEELRRVGLPDRARRFFDALVAEFNTPVRIETLKFTAPGSI